MGVRSKRGADGMQEIGRRIVTSEGAYAIAPQFVKKW
jgi:hypothetical protein